MIRSISVHTCTLHLHLHNKNSFQYNHSVHYITLPGEQTLIGIVINNVKILSCHLCSFGQTNQLTLCLSLQNKKDILIKPLKRFNIEVCCLQETKIHNNTSAIIYNPHVQSYHCVFQWFIVPLG